MPSPRRAEWLWAGALALGPAALLLLTSFPWLDVTLRSAEIHFVIVTLCTLLAIGLAAAVLNAARRHGDGRALLIGAAFLAIASIFSIHAIATPNVIFTGRTIAVSWSGLLSLVVGGLILALSGLPISPALSDWLVRRFWLWLGALAAAWLVYAIVVLALLVAPAAQAAPAAAPGAPAQSAVSAADEYGYDAPAASAPAATAATAADEHDHSGATPAAPLSPQRAGGVVGLAAYGVALWRYGALYRQRRSAGGLALLGGIALLGEALLAQLLSGGYNLTFWLYHLLELAGCLAITLGVVLGLREGAPGAGLFESLLLPGTTARLREGYTRALDRLVEDLEQGAAPGGAAELRLRFGLSESQLAVIERAAAAVAEERQRSRQLEALNVGLHRLEQDREQLTQLVVHDLKNPITAIGGYLDFLRMSKLSDDQGELVGFARRSVNGLQALVEDLLDIGRLEAGRLELQREPVELDELLRRCADQLSHWAYQGDMTVVVEAPPGLPALVADRRLLERLLLNLLSNAIKHTPAGTRITLRATADGTAPGWLALEVADDGPGIPAERLATVFDKYASGGDGVRQRSSGLGLTLCRLVAEAHGGRISVASAEGQGTQFRVELPAGG